MVRPDSREIPRVSRYSGTPLNEDLRVSHTGLSPSLVCLSRHFRYRRFCNPSVLPQPRDESRFVLCPLSLAATYGIDVSFFSSGYLDVSVPQVSSLSGDLTVGFPHSEILGSKLIRSSPRLIAAYYVLHRLHAPRHPLDALKALDRSHYQCPQPPASPLAGKPLSSGKNEITTSCDVVF